MNKVNKADASIHNLHTPPNTSKCNDQILHELNKAYDEIKTSVQN